MQLNPIDKLKWFALCLTIVAIGLPVLLALAGAADPQPKSNYKVFIAFGFHVNLYHSFRNDTNDDSGFGKDIRIIRHIIRTLDRCNANGIPVKGVWDFDNLFSLQEILPQYAPDIIEDIRRRVHEQGDEVILMSYNNGLVSAMTRQELDDAVRWSITNPWQSGVQDLFGKYATIVRPQEMMTTPGSFSVYKKYGIKAVALYYSATPFDAIRVFSRPLSRLEAHNPVLYRHPTTKEEMVVIPTYHFGDLLEHVSLKRWVGELRALQAKGGLNQDALIFINYDADSELWSGIDLPWIMDWLPNTGGIGALVNEVRNLTDVQFTTLADYLAHHPPVGTFSFSQDTADGSFNGYNSWAEKADVSPYWTTIERSRHVRVAAIKAMEILKDSINTAQLGNLITFADMKRLRALSTTHFGMATPFMARQRELAMADLVNDLDGYSDKIEQLIAQGFREHLEQHPMSVKKRDGLLLLDTVLVLQQGREGFAGGNHFVTTTLPGGYKDGMHLMLLRSDGEELPAVKLGIAKDDGAAPRIALYIARQQALTNGIYQFCALSGPGDQPAAANRPILVNKTSLSNSRLAIQFQAGRVEGIYLDGVRQVHAGSLMPWIKWGDKTFQAQGTITVEHPTVDWRSASIRVTGPLPGPIEHTLSQGWMDYRFTLLSDLPYLMVQARIRYPSTEQLDFFKTAVPVLMRRVDLHWHEVAPAEILFAPPATRNDSVRILKQNYLGVATEYALDYFRYSDRNLNLDDVNNQISESYVGLVTGDCAMAVAMDTSTQSNFAFAPLKLRYNNGSGSFTVRANPFGTYHGRQYTPPTWGNGNGFEATLLAGEQFASAGPTYNGVLQNFSLLLAFFNGRQMPEKIRRDLVDFAHPPMVVSSARMPMDRAPNGPLAAPKGFVAAYEKGAVQFGWDNDRDPQDHYRILCGTAPGSYEAVYPAVGNSLRVAYYIGSQPFIRGRRYVATIERVSANGRVSSCAREIQFSIGQAKEEHLKVPLKFELKVLWANLHALLTRSCRRHIGAWGQCLRR
jgi:hypothetical protein